MEHGVETSALRWRKSTESKSANDCAEAAPLPDGGWALRDSKLGLASPVLMFTGSEWAAFVSGVKDGQFD